VVEEGQPEAEREQVGHLGLRADEATEPVAAHRLQEAARGVARRGRAPIEEDEAGREQLARRFAPQLERDVEVQSLILF
jgi:hypothetical protein